ncbi:hypothetical protein WKW80_17305 [Variovorax humicola]|uniref:Uncharacterized protein n=1 Tax=Variovorax humicola TaxID=1769758 RepID=A0ABU8W290_9BURK
MRANDQRHSDWRWHREGDHAASQPSLPQQLPDDATRTPVMSDSWDKFGLTSQERAAVRNIYVLFESTQTGGMRRGPDPPPDLQALRFHAHPADGLDNDSPDPDPPLSSGRLWIRAVCLLIVAAAVLTGWVWLVRVLLAP